MTPEEVKRRVSDIWFARSDPELAHGAEDALFTDVLQWIADKSPDDAPDLAREALRSRELDFPRWTA